MQNQSFTTTILVDKTPQQAFEAISNLRGWWSENVEGSTDMLNSEFKYHYQDMHLSRMKVEELVPAQKVVWHMLDNKFKFTKDKSELTGSKLIFEIGRQDGKTAVHFTHEGLTPACECYDVCTEAWDHFIKDSLHDLIAKGKGDPTPKDGTNFNDELIEKWKLAQ